MLGRRRVNRHAGPAVKRVLLCSGKVYYDLLQARAERGITDTAIIRMEQLYPLPVEEIKAALAQYPNAEDFAWVQEEPANQGAWSFIALNLLEHLEGVRPAAHLPPGRGRPGGRLGQDARRRAGGADRGGAAAAVTLSVDTIGGAVRLRPRNRPSS